MSKESIEAMFKIGSEVYSKKSDIWSFGMTVFVSEFLIFEAKKQVTHQALKKLLTKENPYDELVMCLLVRNSINEGNLPTWPGESQNWLLTHQILRRMCQSCWQEPSSRPTISTVVTNLRNLKGMSSIGV